MALVTSSVSTWAGGSLPVSVREIAPTACFTRPQASTAGISGGPTPTMAWKWASSSTGMDAS